MKEFIDKLIGKLEERRNKFALQQCIDYAEGLTDGYEGSIRIVNQLAEEYKVSEMPTGWISVSERLPEDLSIVLVTDKDGFLQVCKFYEEDKEFRLTWDMWRLNVLAWQPLPAPYTEGE